VWLGGLGSNSVGHWVHGPGLTSVSREADSSRKLWDHQGSARRDFRRIRYGGLLGTDESRASLGAAMRLHCQRLQLKKKLEGKGWTPLRVAMVWVMGTLVEKW